MRSDELDKILDSALSSYSQKEPRPGLESRVVNRIRASREARKFPWLRWAVAIPVLASLLIVFWILDSSQPARSKLTGSAATPQHVAALQNRDRKGAFQSRDRKGAVNRLQKHAKDVPLPKEKQFPIPASLTDEERTLLAFVARSPKQAEELLGDAKSRTNEPIEIKEIQIEPLQDGGQE
jgi:hypothetical protein